MNGRIVSMPNSAKVIKVLSFGCVYLTKIRCGTSWILVFVMLMLQAFHNLVHTWQVHA